jgi:hydroxymethylglutaryl-CoA lyase
MMSAAIDRVTIYEVSPRDGLQNEAKLIDVGQKKLLIQSLVGAGLSYIEVTSYVSPRWIPQLADADELTRDIARPGSVRFSALCPNTRGLERAIQANMQEVAVFLSASETHNLKNTNRPIQRSLEVFSELVPMALAAGLKVRAYVSTVWGCPYEGWVDPARTADIADALLSMGCYQISLGDTIGVGNPKQTQAICELMSKRFDLDSFALHMHDTRGTALANVLAGLQIGVRNFDSSLGGMGGCPYAPGASGNVATEDLVYMLEEMGIDTGVHLPALVEAVGVAERIVGRPLPGKLHQAGLPRLR